MERIRNRLYEAKERFENHVKKFGKGTFLGYSLAIIPRFFFVFHAVLSVRLLEKYMKYETIHANDKDILVATQIPISPLFAGLILLGFESVYTLVARKGHEYKHIWFSGLLYLVTEIPVIFYLEYSFFKKRKMYSDLAETVVSNGTTNIAVLTKPPYEPDTYVNCFHSALQFNCTEQFIRKFAELGLICVIIIGRWMLPRGELTRDQLSALLIGYVNTAADLTEFVGLLTKTEINSQKTVVVVVLVIYSLSLMQFTVVTTSTTYEYSESEKEEINYLTRNLSQHRVQSYLEPRAVKMRQSDMSRSVDKLAKDVFRTGQRVGRRGRAVLPESDTMKEKGQNKTAKEKLVNETIYEESQECWEKNNQFEGQTNDKEQIASGGSNEKIQYDVNSNEPKNGAKRLKAEAFEKWQSDLHVSIRLERVRKSVTQENWKDLSDTLKNLKRKRYKHKHDNLEFDENLKQYPSEILPPEEEFDDCDDQSSWSKWIEVVQTEMGGLLIALLLQEIPFFFTRVAFMYNYRLFDRGLIFYTIKNFFMLSFLNYRLWVATTDD